MPVWLISPEFKSQVGADKGRVLNPERSPSAHALILPWSWLIFWHLSGRKPRCFCHVSLGLCLGFSLLLPRLTCWETTVHSRAWHPHIKPVTGIRLCICNVSVLRKENMPLKPASQTRGRSEVIYHFVCLGCKKKKKLWQVSVRVQPVKREARAVMGSVHTMLLFHINNEHQLSIRCRQMKAIS